LRQVKRNLLSLSMFSHLYQHFWNSSSGLQCRSSFFSVVALHKSSSCPNFKTSLKSHIFVLKFCLFHNSCRSAKGTTIEFRKGEILPKFLLQRTRKKVPKIISYSTINLSLIFLVIVKKAKKK
jgi:hypothetical protein